MGWVLRRGTERQNPTLAGGVYGRYITAGRGVYWHFEANRIHFVLFISDGGRYGMDSSAVKVSYKGTDIPPADYLFHPGTLTKQITPYQITFDHSTNRVTLTAHPFNNDDVVRLRSRGGNLPVGVSDAQKYYVVEKTTNAFRISETLGGAAIDFADAGSGTQYVWKADSGFDDPIQGLPTFCPQTKTCFSGICYVEGKLPTAYNQAEEPDWQDFRVEGLGRCLMDYDASGAELGVVSANAAALSNPALCGADCLIVDYHKPLSRIDFPSLISLKSNSDILVWQRGDTTQSGTGWIGKYYNYLDSPPPVLANATLILTRRDAELNFDFQSAGPAAGVNADFIAVWESQLKFKYAETYTFKVTRDNGARIYFNGAVVYDHWTNTTATDDTFTFAAAAGQIVQVKIEYFDGGSIGKFILKWQSASLPVEIVPMQAVYEPDRQIPRYEFNGACAAPTEAAEYFERIMMRCPGWDWTDKDGKLVFLSPARAIAYEFLFDSEDPDILATFLDGTFEKKLRHRRDRRNFALWSFRNRLYTGFPEGFVEENRPRLRELGNGMPDNDAPEDLMVMFEGQARRVAAAEFKLTSDPKHNLSLSAQKPSGVVTKNAYVRVRNWVEGDRRIEDAICLVTSLNRQGNKLDFTLLPIEYPFYTDEVV